MLVKLNYLEELEPLCDLAVRSLDEIIDHQKYPVKAAEVSTRAEEVLVLVTLVLLHYLKQKLKVNYNDKQAWKEVDELTEHFSIILLNLQMNLQKKKVNVIILTEQSIQKVSTN